jgi:hypothetical protein
MSQDITWKDSAFLLVTGLLFAGNIAGGHPFAVPNNAEAIGFDLFSLVVWGLFFWNLWPFIRKGIVLVKGATIRAR